MGHGTGLTGKLDSVFNDPYWYGGWPYLGAYSPLAYGTIGVLSAASPIPIEISYRVVLFLAYVGLGLSVYALALEFDLRRSLAVWAGLLSLLSYPIFVSLGIFGWFSTVVALPFGVAGLTVLERSVRTDGRRAAFVSGVLFGGSLLAHHMTGFAFAIGMVPWALYQSVFPSNPRRRILRMVAYSLAGVLAASGVWLIFFLVHITSVGFEREVPGNWPVDVNEMARRAMVRSFIGAETYPSYIGLVHVPLAISGVLYAIIARLRAVGVALVLAAFAWFAFGEKAMPLIGVYPFSGLDVARFSVFMVPFLALFSALFVEAVARYALPLASRLRLLGPALAMAAVALLLIPAWDALEARRTLVPVRSPLEVDLAMEWLRRETAEEARILTVGFRNWDAWWVPQRTGRPVMDGWNDEGAPNWRTVREVRHMSWQAKVDSRRLHDIMGLRDTGYLIVYQWQAVDSPQLFEAAVGQNTLLFERRATWPGMSIFERLQGM